MAALRDELRHAIRHELWEAFEQELAASEVAAEVEHLGRIEGLSATLGRHIRALRQTSQLLRDRLREACVETELLRRRLDAADIPPLSAPHRLRKVILLEFLNGPAAEGLGFRIYPSGEDGGIEVSGADIGCATRRGICAARCCARPVVLTREEVELGIYDWDPAIPFQLRRQDDGYCVYLDRGTRACTVYGRRPHVCRRYTCARDGRVWADFEQMEPAKSATQNDRDVDGPKPAGAAASDD
jgi:hypothetical protein